MTLGNPEARRRSQTVICVQRRGVALCTAFTRKDPLSTGGFSIEVIRIDRRLKQIDVLRKRVKLCIAITLQAALRLRRARIRQPVVLGPAKRNKTPEAFKQVHPRSEEHTSELQSL